MNRNNCHKIIFYCPAVRNLAARYISIFTLPVLFSLCLSSCSQVDIYEKDISIPGFKWMNGYKVTGSIMIKDTTASYSAYIVLRHTDAYRYNNIWLQVGIQPPGDSMYYQKLNLQLGSDNQGWEGAGMDDIWEVRKLIRPDSNFFRIKTAGEYRFSIGQEMRDNPLPNVMRAGLRIEKEPR